LRYTLYRIDNEISIHENLAAAREEAIRCIRTIFDADVQAGRPLRTNRCILITDADRRLLLEVPFRDALL
jgi:hypothetical protein